MERQTAQKVVKKTVVNEAVVKKVAIRAAKTSAKLENREAPAGHVRSAAVKLLLAERQNPQALMPLTLGYGETPLPEHRLIALLPHIVEAFDQPTSRADVEEEAEQAGHHHGHAY